MLNCPFCGCDLTKASLNGERCPACGARLIWDDGPSDSKLSSPPPLADLPRSPVVEDREPSIKEVLNAFFARGHAPAPRKPNGGELDKPPATRGASADAVDAVSDRGAAPSTQRRDARPSSNASESDSQPPAEHSPHAAHMRTIDPRELSPEQAEVLATVWKPVIPAQASARMTLKADTHRTAIAGDLMIPPRNLQQGEATQLESTDYRLLSWIGEGGVGIVHAARQVSINRTVAVKMLKSGIADDPDQRNKFLIEAVVTGDLDHPNIVPIYELGVDQSNALFYSMKRVQGTPWSDVIREKSTAENLDILMNVADAIAFAHSRGVIHRDLKPENVMLGEFGEVLVMDWGIALSTSAFLKSGRITQSSSMGGTPAYMAPEMATGPMETIGTHSDVYLLGAILFEIVTGHPPHTGIDVLQCLRAVARNEIALTDESGELMDVAYRALATQAEDRYASVRDFQSAIRLYQAHGESIILAQRAAETLSRARETLDYQDFARALFAYQEALAIWDENEPAQSGSRETTLAYAQAAYEKGDYDLGLSMLDPSDPEHTQLLRKLEKSQEERTARQRRLKRARQTVLALATLVFVVVSVALFTVKKYYNQAVDDRDVARKATELATANAELATKNATLARSEAIRAEREKTNAQKQEELAKEQTKLALTAKQQAEAAKRTAEAASYLAETGLAADRIGNNAFLDALRLLDTYGDGKPRAHYRNWEWGHLEYLCQQDRQTLETDGRVESIACSGDGQWLVAGTSNGQIHLWNRVADKWQLVSDENWPVSPAQGTPVYAVAISPDGQFVVSGGGERPGQIRQWKRNDNDRFEPQEPLEGHVNGSTIFSLRFSADGSQLLSASSDATARIWDLSRSESHAFRGHSGTVYAAAFHPDLSHVVTASEDGTVRVWPVPTQSDDVPDVDDKRIRFVADQGPVYAADFSPDGTWVAAAGHDGRILVWDWQKAAKVLQDLSQNDESQNGTSPRNELPETILKRNEDRVHVFRFKRLENALNKKSNGEDIGPGQETVAIGLQVLSGHSAEVRSLAFSNRFDGHEGNFLVSCGNDNTVKVWLLQDSLDPTAPRWTFRGHGGWVRSAAFLQGGAFVASGGYDRRLKIWDAKKYEEVRVLREHDERSVEITDASLSVDGQQAITAGRDGIARVWDIVGTPSSYALDTTNSGTAEAEQSEPSVTELYEGHEFLVSNAIFFPEPDDRRLLTSAGDGTVRLWDYVTGGQLRTFDGIGPSALMTLSDDGRWLLTGGQENEAYLWNVEEGQESRETLEGHSSEVTAVAISHGGDLSERTILTGDATGACRLWGRDAENKSWKPRFALNTDPPGYPITAAAFLPKNQYVLAASQNHTVMCWEVATGKRMTERTLKHPGSVRAMDVSSDGKYAVTVCQFPKPTGDEPTGDEPTGEKPISNTAYQLSYWNLVDGALLYRHELEDSMVTSIALSPHTESALVVEASSGTRGRVFRWEYQSDKSNWYAPVWNDEVPRGEIWAAAESRKPGYVLTVGGNRARLWRDSSGEQEHGALKQTYAPHGQLTSAAFSPSGNHAVTADNNGDVKLWKLDRKNRVGEVTWNTPAAHGNRENGSPYAVNSAVFRPNPDDVDGYLLTAGEDGTARLWRLSDDQPPLQISILAGHSKAIQQAVFSRDGKTIATVSSDGTARVWDASDPEHVTIIQSLLPDGIAGLGLTCADFSPDGKRVVIGGEDNIAKIWDYLDDAASPVLLKGHTASITSVAFSPDGQRVVSGSRDGMARVWDAASEARVLDTDSQNFLLSLHRHTAAVTAVAFSSTGDRILTASSDKTAIVWLATPISPTILLSDTPLAYPSEDIQLGKPILIDENLQLFDPDTPQFDGWTLNVAIQAPVVDGERLEISDSAGGIQLSDSTVHYGVNGAKGPIGTIRDGAGNGRLEIALTENATVEAIEALLRTIAYSSTTALQEARTIQFELAPEAKIEGRPDEEKKTLPQRVIAPATVEAAS